MSKLKTDDVGRPDDDVEIPLEVVKLNVLQGFPLIRAWREYLELTQQRVAYRMGIKQSSYATMEAEGAHPCLNPGKDCRGHGR